MTRTIMLLPAITGAWKYKESGCFVGSIEEMWNVDLQKLQRPISLMEKTQDQLIWFNGKALNDKKLDPPIKHLFVWNSDVANCTPIAVRFEKVCREKIYLQ